MADKQNGAASAVVLEPLLADKELEEDIVRDGSLSYNGLPASKRKTGGIRSSYYILGYYFLAQAALAGTSVNLVVYTRRVLGLDSISAVLIGTNYIALTYLTSFFGGIFADGFVGRFMAAGIYLLVFVLGLVLLATSAMVPSFRPPPCTVELQPCKPASTGQIVFFFLSLFLIAVGYGGSEPCAVTFGADQYDEGDSLELTQQSSFFNWQALAYSLGLLSASTVIVYIEDTVGYGIGFIVCVVAAIAATCSFFAGTPIYRFRRHGGNPFSRILHVIMAAAYKWKVQLPDKDLLYEANGCDSAAKGSQKRKKLSFLDKASAITDESEGNRPWHLCTKAEVEEVKNLVNLLPVSLTTLIYCMVHIQIFTLFVTQGLTMDPMVSKFQVPPASLNTFNTLTSAAFTMAYELVLSPLIRRFSRTGKGMNTATRIVIGLVVSVLAMGIASLVERRRLDIVEKYDLFDQPQVPMTILWQIPQYVLVGLSEVFAYVGLTEFYYMESPEALRGASTCFFLLWVAFGSFLSSSSVMIISRLTRHDGQPGWIANNLNRGHLDYFFILLAAISTLNVAFTMAFVHTTYDPQGAIDSNDHKKDAETCFLRDQGDDHE